MWDVAWTDPKRELVGEHRGKKDKDRSLTEKSLSRNSISTTSSKTSGHSALSRFRVRALRQSSSSKASSKPNMYSPSEPRTPDNSIDTRSSAAMSDTEQRNARDPLKLHAVLRAESTPSNFSSSMRRSKNTNMKKTKNKVPARSASIGSSAAQSNDGDIFSTKGKEKEKTPIIEHSNGSLKQHGVIGICPQRPDLQSPIRRSFAASPLLPPRSLSRLCPVTLQNEPVKAVPLITSQMQPIRKPVLKFSPIDDISMWRSPREWSAATETKDSIRKIETVTGVKAKKPETVCSARLSNPCDSAAEVKQMAQAKPSTALSKLKTSVEDALSLEDTQKVNEEKKRWMLSVLHHLDRSKRHDSIDANILRNGPEMLEQATGRNILAAYEPSFSARYLAALWPENTVHHLSDNPLSSESAPNICAIYSPHVSSPFPGPLNHYDAVYSMALASLCRESDIPTVLANVNKCLRPGGVYHLLLIDPIPNTDALGENMRAWFRNNLLLKLRQQSRCLTPSCVFPKALGESSLRGQGSTLTTTKFYANPQNICHRRSGVDFATTKSSEGKETRAELRSIVGRMLWREVWGEFVTSDTWWWEDPVCMQECLELGTFWEYHSIQAVKSN